MDADEQAAVKWRYKASVEARRDFNLVLINQLVWQPTLTHYERDVLVALRQDNKRYDGNYGSTD